MNSRPDLVLGWAAEGTAVFEAAARTVTDAGFTRPSLLPGWTRAHVVAHVARNADALVNLLTWARTGVTTPMYTSPEQRSREIEEGARLSPDELRADLRAAGARLAEAADALPEAAWDARVRTARGREVPVSQTAWMRVREVWVHAVDLDAHTTFDDLPPDVCAALLDDVTASFTARADAPRVRLRAVSGDREWAFGAPGTARPVTVTAEVPSLAAYATGRPVPAVLHADGGEPLPVLPAWL
ncbi:maleylpyruvate isomerase family mycothiol-dependent enzyme [Streptomyces sp. NPDC048278]|uniref:maleylpyruvate isomerase family mycothiol-dependent enzyme n=1 Tax=Streptomyces sp. NPDC048278 TaxID=3155809 RepID=UPI00343C9E4C